MKFIILSSLLFSVSAFVAPRSQPLSSYARKRHSTIFSTDISEDTSGTTEVSVEQSISDAKAELLGLASSLKEEYGLILIDSEAKDSFRKAVEKLESVAEVPADSSLLVGDWTLVCSSSSSTATENIKIDTSKIPFFKEGPVRDIKDTLNDSIEVLQRIKFGEESNSIDAIDHIIDYKPPNQLSSFLKNIPDAIKNLDINPLKVSETKVVLKHKAEVEGVIPVIKTKLNLQAIVGKYKFTFTIILCENKRRGPGFQSKTIACKSSKSMLNGSAGLSFIVSYPNVSKLAVINGRNYQITNPLEVNVAGESKNLEPNGEDVLGINLPFGDLLNAGSFETTFLDESMRISRSKTGPVDQIRVFRKSETEGSSGDEDDEQQAVDDDLDDDEIVDDDDDDDELADETSESPIDAEIVDDDDEIMPEAPSDIEN